MQLTSWLSQDHPQRSGSDFTRRLPEAQWTECPRQHQRQICQQGLSSPLLANAFVLTSSQVIQKIGLCICLYDILKVQDGIIGYGSGEANVNVEFRLIVFRPFKGEIILGQIASASEAGMKSILPLHFFLAP